MNAPQPVNADDFEVLARERLDDGVYGYFAGGAGDETTLEGNRAAFGRWRFRPRVLIDVSRVTTATTVLGSELSMPLAVAPVAFQRLAHADGEEGMARATARAGTAMAVSTLATATPEQVAAAAPDGTRWFQVYCFRDRGITRALIDQAEAAGYRALLLTVDAPLAGRRERDLRTGFRLPPDVGVPSLAAAVGKEAGLTPEQMLALMDSTLDWRALERLIGETSLPLVVKGIATGEDAALCVENGAAGVVVSNHGGRQLDGAPATLDALPEVVEAVDGRAEVLMDGGIRRGADVVKALALGARAVLAGRAPLWGLAAGGEAGAARVLELLREEIALALVLCGCPSPDAVTRAHVAPAPR